MTTTLLQAVARALRAYAIEHPWRPGVRIALYRRRIAEGLTAEFYLNAPAGDFTLALAREGADPGESECKQALAAFGAPVVLTRSDPIKARDGVHVKKYYWKREHDTGHSRQVSRLEEPGAVQATLAAIPPAVG